MKIKQLLTSFLACMALWSAPVHAYTPTRRQYQPTYSNDKITKVLDTINPYVKAKERYEKVKNAPASSIDKTNIEQLRQDALKKKERLDYAESYKKSAEDFNTAYTAFLEDLKTDLDNAPKERKERKKTRNTIYLKMYTLTTKTSTRFIFKRFVVFMGADWDDSMKEISAFRPKGITKNNIDKDLKIMRGQYDKMNKANASIANEIKNVAKDIEQYRIDYEKANLTLEEAEKEAASKQDKKEEEKPQQK